MIGELYVGEPLPWTGSLTWSKWQWASPTPYRYLDIYAQAQAKPTIIKSDSNTKICIDLSNEALTNSVRNN
ncbi:MAG TPA: hypothetical protein DEF48_17020 [Nostoc sp. UBA8866]|nr:hypothetical protein DSM107007_50180 [Nostoc sp. PCC 7120 = FACHB-418]HBW31738.1 hypothetical protein [Nostoc sp. UBA8866]